MTVDHRHHHLDPLRAGLSVIVYPLRMLVNLPGASGSWLQDLVSTRRELHEEIDRLNTQQLLLKAQLQKLTALETENLRLHNLLDSSFRIGEKILIAELLSVDMDPYRHQVLVDKGELQDVYQGQPLLDADGVMGQIIHVSPLTSTAMLITDPGHAIPVQVNRNGLRSIALGTGSINRLELAHIPTNADIRPGDQLMTSGLGGRFPRGYPVAVVTAIQQDPGQTFARVSAKPVAHLDRSREILLVWLPAQALANHAAPDTNPQPGAQP